MSRNNIISYLLFASFLHLPFLANAIIEITSVTPINAGNCDGEIDITASGPVGNIYPCTFLWTGPNGFTANTEDLTGLCTPGMYSVKITYANGACYSLLTATVVNCNLAFQPIQTIKNECAGVGNGSIQIAPSPGGTGPFTYSWDNGATTQNLANLSSGQYCLTITDVYGCKSKSECYNISAYDPLQTIAIESYPEPPNCNGGHGTINITFPQPGMYSPPFTYLWSTGETDPFSINVYTSNYYSVTVTDGCNNTATASELYTVVKPIQVELSVTNFCSLPTDVLNNSTNGGGGPYIYHWSNAQTTADIHVVSPGTYWVTVNSALGCTATQSIELPINQQLLIEGTVFPPSFGICQNGYINLNVLEGQAPYLFSWSGPNGYHSNAQNIAGLGTGNYCVTVTDENECTTTSCFNLVQNTTIGIGSITNVSICSTNNYECSGATSTCNGTINLLKFGTAQLTYLWSNGSTSMNIANLCQGTYTVTITGANGCTQTLSASICCCYPSAPTNYPSCLMPCYLPANQPPPAINLTISSLNAPQTNTSKDGSININVTGGFSNNFYSWTGPNGYLSTSQNISNIGQGTYCLTVTNGCSSTNTCVQINSCSSMNLQVASKTNNCDDFKIGQIDISLAGGNAPYTFMWSNGNTTEDIIDLTGGTYTVTVTDHANCTKTVSSIILQTPPIVSITAQCTEIKRCGSQIKVTAGYPIAGGYSDCTSFISYCSLNGLPMGVGQDEIENIFNPEECLLSCMGGADLEFGQPIEHYLVSAQPSGCNYSNACVFSNIAINGTFYESYFVPSGNPTVVETPDVIQYVVCPENNTYCRAILSCPNGTGNPVIFLSGCIYTGEVCGTYNNHDNQQKIVKNINNLDDYVDAIKTIYGFSEVGVPIDVFPEMPIKEYEKNLMNKQSYPVLPYSKIRERYNGTPRIETIPNPFNEFCRIKTHGLLEIINYTIVDMLGNVLLSQEVQDSQSSSEIIIDTRSILPGVYLLICKSTTGAVFSKKILKFSNK